MSAVIKFFSRTHGKNKLSFIDWIAYLYLFLGFLIIFLPVLWLLLNSIKSQFLLLGSIDSEGKVTLVHPSQKAENGLPIA